MTDMVWFLIFLVTGKPDSSNRASPPSSTWQTIQDDFEFCRSQLDQDCMRATIEHAYRTFPHFAPNIDQWALSAQEVQVFQQTIARYRAVFADNAYRLLSYVLRCPLCSGSQVVLCLKCEGKERITINRSCKMCRNGQRAIPPPRTACGVCNGSGRESSRDYVVQGPFIEPRYSYWTCRSCQGTGYRPWSGAGSQPSSVMVPCAWCNGHGTVNKRLLCDACKRGKAKCPRCRGDGRWHAQP